MARPLLPWRSPLYDLPAADVPVWVRRLPWYDKPQLAVFDGYDTFIVEPTLHSDPPDTLSLSLNFSIVHSWKFRYLADEQAAFPPE